MMKPNKPQQCGASRFDFAISVSVIALLATALLFALIYAQNQVEAITMETDLVNMRWGLRELWSHRNATGQSLTVSEIDNANPIKFLNDQPENYRGEYAETPPDAQSIWYFDTKTQRLVYVFSDGHQLRYRLTGTAKLDRASLGAMGGIDLVLDQ